MTRKTRRVGGALLGEGSKGIVYDLSGDQSFHSWLSLQSIDRIKLHGVGNVPVSDFINYLNNKPNRIAKILKNRTYKNTKKDGVSKRSLEDEIWNNKRIIKLFGNRGKSYLTIDPELEFDGLPFISCKLFTKDGSTNVIFGKKCGHKKELDLDKLIIDILECLKICSNKRINHNDIKLDNIMYCQGRYKLIDWGNATFNAELRSGLYAGPAKIFMMTDNVSFAKRELIDKLIYKKSQLLEFPFFKSLYKDIVEEFDIVKNIGFKHLNHDLFGLGLTLVEILNKNQLDSTKYVGLIKMLTSYENPTTVEKALTYTKNLR